MATYSFHKLIMEKEEIDNFLCYWGYLLFKNLLLRNHIWDEAETWHTCLGH